MNVGFVGCGNMGGAIALAASKSSLKPQIYLADHNAHKVNALCEKISAHAAGVQEIAEICDEIKKKELLSAVEKSGKTYEEIMRFLNGEKQDD